MASRVRGAGEVNALTVHVVDAVGVLVNHVGAHQPLGVIVAGRSAAQQVGPDGCLAAVVDAGGARHGRQLVEGVYGVAVGQRRR